MNEIGIIDLIYAAGMGFILGWMARVFYKRHFILFVKAQKRKPKTDKELIYSNKINKNLLEGILSDHNQILK